MTVFVGCPNQEGGPMAVDLLPEANVGDLQSKAALQDSRFQAPLVAQWGEDQLTEPQRPL